MPALWRGLCDLGGGLQCAELGYISLPELFGVHAELDLYFPPCTLRECKAALAAKWG